MRVTAKRCPSCGKLAPICDMVGDDEQDQRCSACVSKALVKLGNAEHEMYLRSLASRPRDELAAIGEQRTREIRRKIITLAKAREASKRQRMREKQAALRGGGR